MKAQTCKKQGRKIIPETFIVEHGKPIFIPLFFADPTIHRQIVWELELQNGDRSSGKAKKNAISLSPLPLGNHRITLIVGTPLLSKGVKIFDCKLVIE